MQTDWWWAIAGGLMIGSAASLLWLGLGRIAGISGISWQAISGGADNLWRWLFLAGMLGGAALAHQLTGLPVPAVNPSGIGILLLAGLLVGFGTRLGSGCTSGHGVCGLARLSPRSLAATLTFMGLGILTVTVMRHLMEGG